MDQSSQRYTKAKISVNWDVFYIRIIYIQSNLRFIFQTCVHDKLGLITLESAFENAIRFITDEISKESIRELAKNKRIKQLSRRKRVRFVRTFCSIVARLNLHTRTPSRYRGSVSLYCPARAN